jgi:hypothetical protein
VYGGHHAGLHVDDDEGGEFGLGENGVRHWRFRTDEK